MTYPPYYSAPYNAMQSYPTRPDMPPYQQNPPQQAIQSPQVVPQVAQGLSPASHPVTNREEANAVSADFSGALMVFPDITNNRVYIKRWNIQAGAAEFMEFVPLVRPQQPQESQPAPAVFASAQELQDLQSLVEDLQKEIARIKKSGGRMVKSGESCDDK